MILSTKRSREKRKKKKKEKERKKLPKGYKILLSILDPIFFPNGKSQRKTFI